MTLLLLLMIYVRHRIVSTRKDYMKISIIKNSIIATAAVFSLVVALPVVAAALPARAEEAQAAAEENQTTAQTFAADKKAEAKTRLADVKLKVCQNRQKAITNIMARISDRGQKQVDLFGTIADRTEAFYTEKGKTLSNYDMLVADVAAKKVNAQTAVDNTKSASTEFNCDGADPKGAVATFKNNLEVQNGALKDYKTAVKNLIVGVKSVQSTTTPAANTTGDNQ